MGDAEPEPAVAVLDRIVDGSAVLLLEADGEVVDERIVEVTALPEEGRHEGAVFDVDIEDGLEATYRPDEERERRERAQERFDRLSRRLGEE
ncbi:DUF3006 family protein [Natrononativus amylolyticus]|uniref:DUF3006 family protein n=1 Tax=Natrononativus amylolyticus TaxID=2963434 RepID=UPI0020CDC26D|nr:DUF3006 family protein [Natrononativus amylolyticus]